MILAAAVFVVAVAILIWLAWRADKAIRGIVTFLEARQQTMDDAEEARRVALFKQQKVMHRTVSQSDRAVRKMVDQAASLRDETLGLHQRMDEQIKRSGGG